MNPAAQSSADDVAVQAAREAFFANSPRPKLSMTLEDGIRNIEIRREVSSALIEDAISHQFKNWASADEKVLCSLENQADRQRILDLMVENARDPRYLSALQWSGMPSSLYRTLRERVAAMERSAEKEMAMSDAGKEVGAGEPARSDAGQTGAPAPALSPGAADTLAAASVLGHLRRDGRMALQSAAHERPLDERQRALLTESWNGALIDEGDRLTSLGKVAYEQYAGKPAKGQEKENQVDLVEQQGQMKLNGRNIAEREEARDRREIAGRVEDSLEQQHRDAALSQVRRRERGLSR